MLGKSRRRDHIRSTSSPLNITEGLPPDGARSSKTRTMEGARGYGTSLKSSNVTRLMATGFGPKLFGDRKPLEF
jgi:hypothetical protein